MAANNWYVITGGPAVGKTTLLAELERRGHTIFPEAARVVIDEALTKGKTLADVRSDEFMFQLKVLEQKLLTELAHPTHAITFFDRGMHDTLAYLQLHGFEATKKVKDAMKEAAYKQVFLLDPLDHYEVDYARTESRKEALKLNTLLFKAYKEYGMEPTIVPAASVLERADFILNHIKVGQAA